MNQCLVPNWNLKQQRQEQVQVQGEEGITRRSSHVHGNHQNYPHPAATLLVPMSNYDEVAELTWKNGQLSMHGLGGLLPTHQEKSTWARAHDTLESIVQQATCQPQKSSKSTREDHAPTSTSSIAASSGEQHRMVPAMTRKRSRSCSDQHGRDFKNSKTNMLEEYCDLPGCCASASATFCRENDTAMIGRSIKDKILEEDSACHSGSEIRHNQDDRDTRAEIGRSNSTRPNRTAAVHNQSERRRRDRINQKMKALQRLVPNASKSDQASMLEEVINYLKQLQAEIQMMSMTSMPQMMMPLAMQQQLQMSMLARSMGARLGMGIGMGMGMGVANINNMAAPRSFPQLIQPTTIGAPATAPIFVTPSFMMPSWIQAHHPTLPKQEPAASSNTNASIPLPAPYCSTTFTQPVNMDLINSMAALYMQQMSQNNQALSSLSQPNHEQCNIEKKCNTSREGHYG